MADKRPLKEILERAARVKLLLMDCDGVLTDGRLYFSRDGEELKVFNIKDGQGIVSWHRAGFRSGVITGRSSVMLERRAGELGMHYVVQGSRDKSDDLDRILRETGLGPEEVAFIGDDLSDLGIMERVGLPVAVRDAVKIIRQRAAYITESKGGFGAVREVTDMLLGAALKG